MLPRHETIALRDATTLSWPISKSELHAIFNGHAKLVTWYTPDIMSRRTRTRTSPGGRTSGQNGGITFV